MARHRLDDEVVRFPETVHYPDGILIRCRKFVRHALDEAHVQAAARDHVNRGQLFGAAQRIGPMPDRITEHEQTRLLGLPSKDCKRHYDRRRHAGGGLVMLIEHDVEPEFVREHPLVIVAVQQIAGDFRVELTVG